MTISARQLAEARTARDAARDAFAAQRQRLRGDPEAESIGGHFASRLGDDARAAFDSALNVASESKGIIAGTLAALALWLLRHPIIAWIDRQLAADPSNDECLEEEIPDERD